ncbi:Chromosomal replication initiator, DnaA C-terminal [uncultured Caudovirales phage]|uniref:Chromosomal replication initiator, DnaA C-terminal n=1 Tax=uncultured Caudovirales phage TaxID=2100421 RepID=A0A6J5T805_9CAUD|nr:Chromosomal replication initiator, DnaA C-terminal [uncultured Caudovirales phage]CAB4195999.1 Chromosomal replication initiator, DnaA C-terminal [uncultured Caudovirales phage]CAB4222637.1 Chromosomal replication initiator, DnaA C-terminal [uncultured Caudovirales phage]
MVEQLPDSIQATMVRTEAALASGRLSPWARARILGLPIMLAPAKQTRITVDCRTGKRTVERMSPEVAQDRFDLVGATSAAVILRSAPMAAVRILKTVAAAFDIPVADILGDRRSIRETRPRFAVYRLLAEAGYTIAAIGRALKRDRTSIRNGLDRAELLHVTSLDWRALFDQVRAELAK